MSVHHFFNIGVSQVERCEAMLFQARTRKKLKDPVV